MSCAVNEAHLAVDVGYWPLYRYTPETDLPTTTDEVRKRTSLHTFLSVCVLVVVSWWLCLGGCASRPFLGRGRRAPPGSHA